MREGNCTVVEVYKSLQQYLHKSLILQFKKRKKKKQNHRSKTTKQQQQQKQQHQQNAHKSQAPRHLVTNKTLRN